MDEDDTFRKLKQIPLSELYVLIDQRRREEDCVSNWEEFLESKGWTREEVVADLLRQLGDIRPKDSSIE